MPLLPPGADPSLTWPWGWELLTLMMRLDTRNVFFSPGLEGAEHRGPTPFCLPRPPPGEHPSPRRRQANRDRSTASETTQNSFPVPRTSV